MDYDDFDRDCDNAYEYALDMIDKEDQDEEDEEEDEELDTSTFNLMIETRRM